MTSDKQAEERQRGAGVMVTDEAEEEERQGSDADRSQVSGSGKRDRMMHAPQKTNGMGDSRDLCWYSIHPPFPSFSF